MSNAYVGVKPCGCAVAAAVICPPLNADPVKYAVDQAKELRRWQRSGLKIRQESVEWVRANLRSCKCTP